ncbi:MAG: hypothetical protein Kow0042_03370 [Calditrichia bacterium]
MKYLGYQFSLLIFFIALLSGFYLGLPLTENLIRAFVIYLVFSALYLGGVLIYHHFLLEMLKKNTEDKKPASGKDFKQATPNVAK